MLASELDPKNANGSMIVSPLLRWVLACGQGEPGAVEGGELEASHTRQRNHRNTASPYHLIFDGLDLFHNTHPAWSLEGEGARLGIAMAATEPKNRKTASGSPSCR